MPNEGRQEDRLNALRRLLTGVEADFEIIPHEMTYVSAEDGVSHGVGTLAEMAPTFILQTERGPMAAVISGTTRLAYKKIKKRLGLRDVALASPQQVMEITGSEVGTVSLVQPGLPTVLDARLLELEEVFGGCGVPRHTLRIRVADLVRITKAEVFDLAEDKHSAPSQ